MAARCGPSRRSRAGLLVLLCRSATLRDGPAAQGRIIFLAYPAFSLRSVWDKSQTYQVVILRKRASGRAGLTCRRAYSASPWLP
jgi:hypothetical protein